MDLDNYKAAALHHASAPVRPGLVEAASVYVARQWSAFAQSQPVGLAAAAAVGTSVAADSLAAVAGTARLADPVVADMDHGYRTVGAVGRMRHTAECLAVGCDLARHAPGRMLVFERRLV